MLVVALACATAACAGAGDPPVAHGAQPAASEVAPRPLVTQDDVERAIQARPSVCEFLIAYRKVSGDEGQYKWQIGETAWRVRLYGVPAEYFDLAKLDTSKTYRVAGYVLEQNFGVVEVWVRQMGPVN
jgi:hypothetical protein